MHDVFDRIREPGSAHGRNTSSLSSASPAAASSARAAADVVLTARGTKPRQWLVVDSVEAPAAPATIIPMARWLALAIEGADLTAVGVIVSPDADIELLRPHLATLPVIAIHYPRFGDGRGYSHARRLRHMFGFAGQLLAVGDVLRDQLVWMWRVGIDHFHLRADQDPVGAQRAFTLYSAHYQY